MTAHIRMPFQGWYLDVGCWDYWADFDTNDNAAISADSIANWS